MSLRPFFEDYCRPSKRFDQHFGRALSVEDLLGPLIIPRLLLSSPNRYLGWNTDTSRLDTGSTVSYDKGKFQANLDVQHFEPEEITVKLTSENEITIEGKHEEKQDEHGLIFRHFKRKYVLPKNCNTAQIESKISSDGVLTITALEYKQIPIQQTGQPVKTIEKKSEEKMKD